MLTASETLILAVGVAIGVVLCAVLNVLDERDYDAEVAALYPPDVEADIAQAVELANSGPDLRSVTS